MDLRSQKPSPRLGDRIKAFCKSDEESQDGIQKENEELFWIRNIEQGTKGAWHIHLVVNEIGDTASILKEAWEYGGTYTVEIRLSDKLYDEDFSKLAEYMTKDENTREKKANGEWGKPRIKQSSYSTSRNMPLKEPKVKQLIRWRDEPRPKKGYVIIKTHEGINPATGYKYRRYTMVRQRGRPQKGG